ncbi:hypothetical protein HK099_003357 [Clydaea vesicula]|uniref:Cell division cycle protein 123 homolog n=1 Tax=Clydaea vesicula TaxID=447962 RepID=A0AAD5Y0Y8_9FUNG|nr:hypothetical protein HK099_003357 [Clydaea vesicula]
MPSILETPSNSSLSSAKKSCQINNWVELFREHTVKTRFVNLTPEFLNYLSADSIFLPNSNCKTVYENTVDNYSDSDSDSDSQSEEKNLPSFPAIEQEIREIIHTLGGRVFPKLNWSSPKDSAWISASGNLSCVDANDIFLLLKSSDFIVNDLSYKDEVQMKLCLRKWYDLQPSMEFRCFVKNNQLFAITQRDHLNYYEFLLELKSKILYCIKDFFGEKIKNTFPENDYTFDIYLTKDLKPFLLDFNPLEKETDTMLFGWEELRVSNAEEEIKEIEFRIVESQQEANFNSSSQMAFSTNRVPKDAIDMSSGVSVIDFMKNMTEQMQAGLTIDSDDEEIDKE